MSAFLGKIHYWLYNKILLQEKLIGDIAVLANTKGFEANSVLGESYEKFGSLPQGELEEIIEHSNIHGWLQEQIISVENRLAYVATELMKSNVVSKGEIANLFYRDGAERNKDIQLSQGSPEDYFQMIFDYLLEGMPCDRVNNITSSTETEMIWETTRDLHEPYWENAGGELASFYEFRNAWINGFLTASGYEYHRTDDGINAIRRVG